MNKENARIIAEIKEKINENKDIKKLSEEAKMLSASDSNFLPSAFAACYNAFTKGLSVTPFDEQLEAGLALFFGKVIQMNTGEGKTFSAVFATFAKVLKNHRVFVLTFNDYLAKRDYNWTKPVYNLLGIKTSYITEKTTSDERKKAYNANVVYITAKECGFDFLRDFVALKAEDMVQTPLDCAIVDEADSILIDEARIPLVIASNTEITENKELPEIYEFIKTLSEEDYETSKERDSVFLTDSGVEKAEAFYNLENIFDEENLNLATIINDCLKAEYILSENKDYIIKNNNIEIIDMFTGRAVKNRHYPGGLQAAVEIKHGLTVTKRGVIMGTIPMQFFVRQFDFLSGMTGTALYSKDEFYQLYNLHTEEIIPHVPSKRIDREIEIYYDNDAKWNAITSAIISANKKRQPVLIGVKTIAEGEELCRKLSENNISEFAFLSAKNDEEEAEIIKNAGSLGRITVSANMAGRGVDIKLGGADEKTRNEVIELGGLLVIGTSLEESSRINAQLKGRSGRQGDVGESRLFVALDDEIMTLYKIKSLVPKSHFPAPTKNEITDKVVLREVKRIQRISEGNTLDERERLLKLTMIGEKHRSIIFETRKKYLIGETLPQFWQEYAPEYYKAAIEKFPKNEVDELQKKLVIPIINEVWCHYLEYTSSLREGIHLRRIGGKNPTDEYNVSSENYFNSLPEQIQDLMCEKIEALITMDKISDFEVFEKLETWTYLLDESGDELNKKQFRGNNFYEDEEFSNPPEPKNNTSEKGFFKKLFGGKK